MAVVLATAPAVAQDTGPEAAGGSLWDVVRAAGLTGGSLWLATAIEAEECRWCDGDPGDDRLNDFDRSARRALVWSEARRSRAGLLSDVTLASTLALPAALILRDDAVAASGRRLRAVEILGLALAVNNLATAGLKRWTARERPLVHVDPELAASASDPYGSFPSAHASSSFAMVVAATGVCRAFDCDAEPAIWWVGLPAATATAYLRMAADRHYATDVLAGAGLGAAVGWLMPRLVSLGGDRRAAAEPANPMVVVTPASVAVRVAW